MSTPSTCLSTLKAEELSQVATRRHVDPAKLERAVRGDLDWIVMKALEKDRTRRYETVNGFAADLQRHLGNEPVLARPPSAAYRMQKAWRRNKLTFTAGAAVLAALALGIAFSTWQAVRANRRLAESEAVTQFLTTVFESPDPVRDGRTITVAEILDTAAKKLETDLATQPARRAELQLALGNTYSALGLNREAILLKEKVRDYHRAASGTEHVMTLAAMHNLALSYAAAGRWDEAIKLQEEVLLLRRKDDPEHPVTLKAMANLVAFYADAGRSAEALKLGEEVLALSRKVLGSEHPQTLAAMGNLALSYEAAGRQAEALQLKEEVLTLSRMVNGPEHPATLDAMLNLATSYFNANRRDEALELREKLLPLSRKVKGPEHPDTLRAMSGLATSWGAIGRGDEELKLREQLLPLSRKVNGPEHPETLGAMTNLAISLGEIGRLAEAIELQQRALVLKRRVLPPHHPYRFVALQNMAKLYDMAGRAAEAQALRQELSASRQMPQN